MAYNNKHRQFLQYFMKERMISEENAIKVNKTLFPETAVDNVIEIINTKIAPLEFKINKALCDQNGVVNYVFVALFVDNFRATPEPSKIVFQLLVNYILKSGGFVHYRDAIKFNNQVSESMIKTFFENKYLVADQDFNVYLSALAVSELDGYLAVHFKEKRCVGCMSIVVFGIKCPSCEQFVHGHCFTTYCQNIGSKKCPKCSSQLNVEWEQVGVVNKFV